MSTPQDELFLSVSQIGVFLRCRFEWFLRYPRRIESYHKPVYMDIGSATHVGLRLVLDNHADKKPTTAKQVNKQLEKWRKEQEEKRGGADATPQEERESLQASVDCAPHIIQEAVDSIKLPNWEIVRYKGKPVVEANFKITLPGLQWKGIQTYVDWVGSQKKGPYKGTWLVDWKTQKSSFGDPEIEDFNLQFAVEQYILAKHKLFTTGNLTINIRNRIPDVPNTNKNGEISRAMIVSTWDRYRQAVIDAGLDPKDYLDMKAKLAPFVRPDYHYRDMAECTQIWKEIILPTAEEMSKAKRALRAWNKRACMSCNMKDFCTAELRGEDTHYLLQTSYVNKDNPLPRILPATVEIA